MSRGPSLRLQGAGVLRPLLRQEAGSMGEPRRQCYPAHVSNVLGTPGKELGGGSSVMGSPVPSKFCVLAVIGTQLDPQNSMAGKI